ncbi:MAG: hypothetical protein IT578_07950 [Verrucomicrobiae bacterium]|nr:hypothetical protein [Verrucomicrobiae bacterium]
MFRRGALLWVAVLAFAARAASPGLRVEVYPLGLTDFELASKVAAEIVSEHGKLFPDKPGNRLIILETDAHHAELRKALATLNAPLKHVRIQVVFLGRNARSERTVSVGGRTTEGEVTVRVGPPSRSTPSVAVHAGQTDTMASSLVQQELFVISGGQAKIFVGQDVPEADWFWSWGLQQGFWTGRVRWREVGASLIVAPYVMDRRIRLRLTPEFSYFLDGKRRVTAIETMTTEALVEDGQEVDLGGLSAENREFATRFLTGYSTAGEKRSLEIRLRANIE